MVKSADSGQIAKARRISEIAEREKKATKGPWFFESRRDPQIEVLVTEAEESNDQYLCHAPVLLPGYELGSSQIDDNWEFIQEARDDIPFLLSELTSERQAVIEECCRAVCYFCVGEPWKPAKLVNGAWIHECDIGPDRIAQCNAAAIRSME